MPRLKPDQPTRNRVAKNLKRLLDEHEKTPVALAEAAGVPSSVVYRIRNADTGATIDVLGRLARGFRCDVREFFA